MNGELTIKFIREIGLPGALLAFMLHAYVKLTATIIPIIQHNSEELTKLITLVEQLLRRL